MRSEWLRWIVWCAAVALTSAGLAARAATEPEALVIQCVVDAGTADTGEVRAWHDLPGAGVLIEAEKGLFLARAVNGRPPSRPPEPQTPGECGASTTSRGRGADRGGQGMVPGARGERQGHRHARRNRRHRKKCGASTTSRGRGADRGWPRDGSWRAR